VKPVLGGDRVKQKSAKRAGLVAKRLLLQRANRVEKMPNSGTGRED
jgi:hypothetical protein